MMESFKKFVMIMTDKKNADGTYMYDKEFIEVRIAYYDEKGWLTTDEVVECLTYLEAREAASTNPETTV